jgi:voltage-gated potassium channel
MDGKKRVKSQKWIQNDTHPHDATYDLFILVLTIFSLAVVALILIWPGNNSEKTVLLRVDFLICVIFFFDFLLNLWRAPNKVDYFFKKGGWLDLLGSIPAVPGLRWTALLRLARLNQGIRILKHLQGRDRDEVFEEARKTPA